ncbi:MAG: uroporphyrinogen decarboxylase [Planctomycetes bacterium]|nr:uroporphyrinogen decarboxylase [Phycisphaerae bacterium]NBB95314.1 uroporphyrinogen decarboxylase [Planctomycetota bacterium]
MTGKERILVAIRCQETDRTPWVPFVGVHGGKLLDITATDYLNSSQHIVDGIAAAVDRYKPDGVPVAFDLQIEAETFGCDLRWSDDTPPAVTSHPLADHTAFLDDLRVPDKNDGRIPVVLDAARQIRQAHPDLAVYGLITGPFTLALHLMGTDIFMKMFDATDEIEAVLAFAADVAKAMADYYIEAGCDIVAVVDPMTSQIGPDPFRHFVSVPATAVFEHIREAGALSSFFVCGHAEQNLQAMCDCAPDNVSVDENIPLETVKAICLPAGVSFGGNLQLTSVLLLGQPVDAQRNAVECMEIGGEKGFILAPGCDLPYATPPENLDAIAKVVADPYERDAVKAMAVEEMPADLLDMSDYGQSEKVIVDVITLDSEACAPCQYMVESVKAIVPEFEGVVEWREHKIQHRESLLFMTSLMVRNIPTICIDGRITFVSRIPAREELIAAIQERILEKMRMRIRQKHGEVFLLCSADYCDAERREEVSASVNRAVAELGADIRVRSVTDDREIMDFGVLPSQTPAIVTANFRVRSTRQSPEHGVIREWIKDLML